MTNILYGKKRLQNMINTEIYISCRKNFCLLQRKSTLDFKGWEINRNVIVLITVDFFL